RHQKWLLGTIITLTIISFVWYFNPAERGSRGSRNQRAAGDGFKLNGKRVTQQMLGEAAREVRLLYFLNFRKWPEQDTERAQQIGFDVETEAYLRLFRVSKADEAGIQVPDKTVAELARRLLGGEADLDRFAKELLVPNALSLDDFERFVRNDAKIQQLSMVVGAAGRLITPADAEALFRREHQEVGGDLVFFHWSNYLSKVVITNGALTNWHTMRGYRTPEKVQVSYVEFARSNFIADADKRFAETTNLVGQLRDIYYKVGPNNFKDTNGTVLSETNALEKIKGEQHERLTMMFAARQANEFANKLYDKQPVRAENLQEMAASNNLAVQVSMPFTRDEGPTNLNVSPKFAQTAFALNATNNPVSFQPIEGENGFYIVALKESIPSQPEPYETITNKVTEDYNRYMAFTLAYGDATNFIAQATNGLAQGKTFDEIAQKAGLKVESLPPISQRTESITNLDERLDVRRLKQVMLSLEPGKVSSYIPNPPDGGYVAYLRARLPLDETKVREELPKFTAELRYQKQNEIFGQWFRKQAEQAKLPLPNRQKRPAS
ncbi:MAG TPA: peptidylprolyl isomerase, partial [Verrucomicrobiae bacterium]